MSESPGALPLNKAIVCSQGLRPICMVLVRTELQNGILKCKYNCGPGNVRCKVPRTVGDEV